MPDKQNVKVFLTHGIRWRDKSTLNPLYNTLRELGVDVSILSYGYVLLPFSNGKRVEKIKREIDAYRKAHPDTRIILVGYSLGAWLSLQYTEVGGLVDHLVFISPALHKYHAVPTSVPLVDVFYSRGDFPTFLAKWHRIIANFLFPWRWSEDTDLDWGEAGKVGLLTKDSRITNHDMGNDIGHSFYNHIDVVKMITYKILNIIAHGKSIV